MVPLIRDFLRRRFVLPRYSISVTPTGSAFRHIALPTWPYADRTPLTAFRMLTDGTTEAGIFVGMVDSCYAEYIFGTPEPLWYAYAPWEVGTFEEISETMARAEEGRFSYYAFATAQRQPATAGERGRTIARCLCVYPVGRNRSAEEQEERFHVLGGFLQEAAAYSDARLTDMADFPNLLAGLTAVGEGGAVMNEVAGLAFKLEFRDNYQTNKRYELQV